MRRSVLGFALLGAPIAWAIQLTSSYAIEEAACSTAAGEPPVLGSPTAILWGISIGAFVVAGLAEIAGLVSWLQARSSDGPEPATRVAFLAAAGSLAGVIF